MEYANLAPIIDHTLLRPNANIAEITQLCAEAKTFGFASVCILPYFVPLAARLLANSTVKVCTVIGFPFGADLTMTKLLATRQALAAGAREIDMVINLAALKSQDYQTVEAEVTALQTLVGNANAILKVIIETGLLGHAEKIWSCEMVKKNNVAFIKTSTGFNASGATVEDVALMRSTLGNTTGIKASGGIKDSAFAQQLVAAGATRLGTSNGIALIRHQYQKEQQQREAGGNY